MAQECGSCRFCVDMVKRGGPGTLKKPCLLRRCVVAPERGGGALARAQARLPAKRPAEGPPGVGDVVWAFLDGDALRPTPARVLAVGDVYGVAAFGGDGVATEAARVLGFRAEFSRVHAGASEKHLYDAPVV